MLWASSWASWSAPPFGVEYPIEVLLKISSWNQMFYSLSRFPFLQGEETQMKDIVHLKMKSSLHDQLEIAGLLVGSSLSTSGQAWWPSKSSENQVLMLWCWRPYCGCQDNREESYAMCPGFLPHIGACFQNGLRVCTLILGTDINVFELPWPMRRVYGCS